MIFTEIKIIFFGFLISDFPAVAEFIGTRSIQQVRSHYQKQQIKIRERILNTLGEVDGGIEQIPGERTF